MAIGEKDRRPVSEIPQLRIVRFSKQSLDFGQTTHDVEGVPLRVFSVAKTVVDCFKYRNKIGLAVALEALRESIRSHKATVDDLWQAAKVCRVANW
jgi:predicted transcriptional regulator of viral defense system